MAAVAQLTSRIHFCAAHRLYREDWSEAQNRELYGPCINDHGHNYVVEATVSGAIDPGTGMEFNVTHLKRFLNEEIFEHVDHRHLNRDVAFLKDVIPTAENLAVSFWHRLAPRVAGFPGARLHCVRVQETPSCESAYFGESGR
jgi:6-pyruvoyltetrahydropterin/6-carboxytetrahydropterin synthase